MTAYKVSGIFLNFASLSTMHRQVIMLWVIHLLYLSTYGWLLACYITRSLYR